MKHRFFIRIALASAVGAVLAAPAVAADTYPVKPIKVIVPYAAGGVVDVQTRAVTESMAQFLKQPIIVEPRPGASGSIAAEAVARAEPDGYTLVVSASFFFTQPLLETNLRWSARQFTPVGRFALSPSYFVVPNSSPAKTIKEFVDYAKKANPPLQYANGGDGAPQTMATELFRVAAGIKLEPVMYKGAPPSVPDLINGLTAIGVLPSTVGLPQIKGGNLRALANASDQRSSQLPNTPTIAEAGFPAATVNSWYGLHAPVGTPPDVIQKLSEAMKAATALPEVKSRLDSAGGEAAYLGTTEFTQFLSENARQWADAVKLIKTR